MFDNIGGKIKKLATITCWIGIILSILVGYRVGGESGYLTMAIGSLLSWVGSFFTYGFGQLVENSDKMVGNIPR